MEPKLRAAEILRARRKRPENLDAFDLYLQALPRLASFSAQGIAEAIGLLGRAVALSPDYAQALAHAAICRVVRPTLGHSPDPDRDLREAAELSRRALESDSTDTVALYVAAFVAVLVDRDYEVGWDLVDKALAINPNDARAWNRRGWISAWAGEVEPAMTAFEKVMRPSPLDPQWGFSPKFGMASALCWDGRPGRSAALGSTGSSGAPRPCRHPPLVHCGAMAVRSPCGGEGGCARSRRDGARVLATPRPKGQPASRDVRTRAVLRRPAQGWPAGVTIGTRAPLHAARPVLQYCRSHQPSWMFDFGPSQTN